MIIARQFEALRAGDAKWFENQGFSPDLLDAIRHTTLSDIIMRNTDTTVMQKDTFLFSDRHVSDVDSEHPDAPQLLIGANEDNAVIVGGEHDDTIVAGLGQYQILTGNGGCDRFMFLQDGHSATITDFDVNTDKIELALSPAEVGCVAFTAADDGSAMIQWLDNTVTLAGVSADQMNAGHLAFGYGDARIPSDLGLAWS